MIVIETLDNSQEPSMDNPVIASIPSLSIGDTFTFKGEHCTIVRVSRNKQGFWYKRQNYGKEAYMSFLYYRSIPSQIAVNGRKGMF